MGLFGHNCSRCGSKCKIGTDGLVYGWVCPNCQKRKRDAKRIKNLEDRISLLEKKGE